MEAGDRPPQGLSQRRWRDRCPICHRGHRVLRDTESGYVFVCCNSCGEYEIDRALAVELTAFASTDPDYRLCRYLGCHTRQQPEGAKLIRISQEDWKVLALTHQQVPLRSKLEKLLELLARRCGAPGRWAEYDPFTDGFLIDEPWEDSFLVLAYQLAEDGCIELERDCAIPQRFRLTVTGQLKQQEISKVDGKREGTTTRQVGPASQRRGKPGPQAMVDDHTKLKIATDSCGDSWSSAANLPKVCRKLDRAGVRLPTTWRRPTKLPESWKDRDHLAESWVTALEFGGREPVLKVIRQRLRQFAESSR